MKIIIGLGNPGKKYEKTRHNAGFIMINKILQNYNDQGADFADFKFDKSHNADISEGLIGTDKLILVKPLTFMNKSGQSVQSLVNFYKIDPTNDLVIIYDDIDLPLGEIRTTGTSAGGHNGMKNIIEMLGTDTIKRIRIGILGKSKDKISDTASYVLKKFGILERKKFDGISQTVIDSLSDLIK